MKQLLKSLSIEAALIVALGSLSAGSAMAQPVAFTPGDVAVYRIGDGSAALSSASTATFIDEYTTAGVFVRTHPISGAATISSSGTATSEGQMQLSSDGSYLVFAGYNTAPGLSGVVGTTAATVQRAVGRIDGLGNVGVSTLGTSAYTGNNVRSATSTNGTDIWTGGTATAPNGGVWYTSFGSGTGNAVSGTVANTRVVNVAAGQLYVSSASGATQGILSVGTGTPTTSGQTMSLLTGFPTAAGPSNYDYVFADPNTIYVADDRPTSTGTGGGIEKWTVSAGTWAEAYSALAGAGGNVGLRSLALSGGTLFGIGTDGHLYMATDSGTTFAFTDLATPATNEVFRSVDFAPSPVPEPGALALCGLAGGLAGGWLRRKRK